MKYIIILSLIIIVAASCNQNHSRNQDASSHESTEIDSFKVDVLDVAELDKLTQESPSLKIIEYDQWKRLIETVITNNGIYRYKKNWQNGDISTQLVNIKIDGFYKQLDDLLQKDFKRNQGLFEDWNGNTYFVHLIINRGANEPIRISFKNCKSKELENLVLTINEKLPPAERIVLKGKTVIDNFIPADSINSWSVLKAYSRYNSNNTFKLKNIDRNIISQLDSTIFGEQIFETYSLKSSYILSVRENIGNFYPCVVLGEQYESDNIVRFLAVFMIDSTFNSIGDFKFISSFGYDYEGKWDYYGTFSDSLLRIDRHIKFECYGEPEEVSELKVQEHYKMTLEGKIETIKKDTVEIKYCR